MTFSKVLKVKWGKQSLLRFVLSTGLMLPALIVEAQTFRAEATVPESIPSLPPPVSSQPAAKAASVPPPMVADQGTKKLIVTSKDKKNRILPLITFYNAPEGDVYNWWAENQGAPVRKAEPPPFAAENGAATALTANLQMWRLSKKILNELMRKQEGPWVYGISPAAIKNFPEAYKKTALTIEEMRDLARVLEARLIVHGDVNFTKSPIIEGGYRMKVHLKSLRTDNGKTTGEVLRIMDIHPWEYDKMLFSESKGFTIEAFNELGTQMLQASNSETRPRNVKLLVSGKLSYAQLEILKQNIQRSVKGVRAIRSESVENEQVALLVDYEGAGAPALSQSLARGSFGPFFTQVVSSDSSQVLFDVMWRGR